ncbi:hypothetical protein ACLB2K_051658 [Fragaria x ananassa]
MAIPESQETIIPLIDSSETQPNTEPDDDTHLHHTLYRFENFLRLFGFCQYSFWSFSLSWLAFLLVGVALPMILIEIFQCANCEKYQIKSFELEILVCESLVAAVSLLCISHNLRKYGVRKFLFVDRYHGHMTQFHDEYIRKINGFFRLLLVWLLPCFLLKTAREITRVASVPQDSLWKSVAVLLAFLVSWMYSNVIFLSGSCLFNLVCNLQVIHFDNYGKLLEMDIDVSAYIEEHIRLSHYLSKISHRFRIYLLLQLLLVTASQFVVLLETTENSKLINLTNGGDFVVSSIVELVGIIICLQAAAKISHRAQGLASVTSRWHAMVTCSSGDPSQMGVDNDTETSYPAFSLPINYSETDLESIDYVPVPTNTQLASYMSMYHKREAFVTYMQSNPGGVTIYGWRTDRALINTIFFVELSLVLFVLGKTITFTTK